MDKKSKGKTTKLTKKSNSERNNPNRASIPSPQPRRSVSFNGTESVTYTAVPITETEDPTAESGGGGEATSPSKSKPKKSKRKEKKVKKKSKRRARNDSDDDDFVELERKPSPVLAPLPTLTREEYEFFEMVSEGEIDKVAEFLQSDSFKDMDINKLNKTGYTVLHIAVQKQDERMVKLLLAQPGIHLYDTLFYAIKEEHDDIVKLLLKEYDEAAKEEQRRKLMSSAINITQDPNEQEQLSQLVQTSLANVVPVVSPLSARSGITSSVNLHNSSNTIGMKSKNSDVPTPPVSQIEEHPAVDGDEIPFDSEFSPVITPLMLAAQQGSCSLIELFYSRNERLETEEFPHDLDCPCDVCTKLEGEQDMTRAYQRHHLYKAVTNPLYICFIARNEHKDPINYAFRKILKIREFNKLHDYAFSRLFDGIEEELEDFVTKMLELCRSTTEAEIFLSPKDSDERLSHSYPRLWYTVGQDLKKFVASPNAQNIVYKLWATDQWPEWDTFKSIRKLILPVGCRLIFWPFYAIIFIFFCCKCDSDCLRPWKSPVSRFLMHVGSHLYFMIICGIQALYPLQRCNKYDILGPLQWIWSKFDLPWKMKITYYDPYDEKYANCKKRGPPDVGTEPILILYVLSFYVNMIKRQSVSWYWRMRWNWIDLVNQLLFTATFGTWAYAYFSTESQKMDGVVPRQMWEPCVEIVSECLLSMAYLFVFVRTLRYAIMIPAFGPIQMGIGHQMIDFLKGLLIMGVVIVSFGSGLMGLYKERLLRFDEFYKCSYKYYVSVL